MGDLLGEIGPVIAGIGSPMLMEAQGEAVFQRTWEWTDLATLTDEWYACRGGHRHGVGYGDRWARGRRRGSRHVMNADGAVLTMAHTDDFWIWTADVPRNSGSCRRRDGATRNTMDYLKERAGAQPTRPVHFKSPPKTVWPGAPAAPFAEGYGISDVVEAGEALHLVAPALVSVDVGDGLPAVVRLDFVEGDSVSRNESTTIGRPGGSMARGYPADGEIEIPVEPGRYQVVVHRGATWEPWTMEIEVVSGQRTALTPILAEVVRPEGVLRMDPHAHASPSGDGRLSMSHRLLIHAANGIQVHFGTDHDMSLITDPLEPLGLAS